MTKATIPRQLAHLPMHGGLPVPFFVACKDGVPDFRVIDSNRVLECGAKRLCGICGRKLGHYGWLIGGDLSKKNHLFSDPPMHQVCAFWTLEVCPFLRGDVEFSNLKERPARVAATTNELASRERPKSMHVLRVIASDVEFGVLNEHLVFKAGRYWGDHKF